MTQLRIIWFRRDLRVHDHAALNAALAGDAPVLALYILQPDLWKQPGYSARQFAFLIESLRELDLSLRDRGSQLCLRVGNAAEVFAKLHTEFGIAAIHAHAEFGPPRSQDRDKVIERWARHAGIALRLHDQHGVVSGLDDPEAWATHWTALMTAPRLIVPALIPATHLESDPWPEPADMGLSDDPCPQRQRGGRTHGVEALQDMVKQPVPTHAVICETSAALAPHLAYGTLSMREAYQGAHKTGPVQYTHAPEAREQAISSFTDQLRQHCTFRQEADRLSRRPLMSDMQPGADMDDPRLAAWLKGATGFPFIDACMRKVQATGTLPLPTRAWLIGFAARHLRLSWPCIAQGLGALLSDYEAGPHQIVAKRQTNPRTHIAGTLDPVNASKTEDPDAIFIRRWVPELAGLPTAYIHAPWTAPEEVLTKAGLIRGQAYPMRIVDHVASARIARMHSVHTDQDFRIADRAQRGTHPRGKKQTTRNQARHRTGAALSPLSQLSLDFSKDQDTPGRAS